MIPSLDFLISKLEPPGIFEADCAAAFADKSGARLLFTLATILCPILSSPVGATVEDTYRLIGRAEVVMALWRRSQPQNMPHPNESPAP